MGNVSAAVPHLSGCRHRFGSQPGNGKYQNQAEKKHKAQFRKRRDIARLSDEEISNAYRVALERHLGQAEPLQDLDENVKKIAMAMEKAAEKTIPEKEMITKKWITLETLSLVQEKRILKKKRQ